MRRLLLEPHLGDLPARHMSVLTGAVLIILVFWFTLKWLGPQPGWRWWEMGLLWLTLTLAFEIGLGRAAGMSWDRIASDFDPRRGGFLALGMLVILVTPRVLAERHVGRRMGPRTCFACRCAAGKRRSSRKNAESSARLCNPDLR
jgi:hypothetical protein